MEGVGIDSADQKGEYYETGWTSKKQ